MMQIDSAILATDKVICKNISRFDDSERGLLSQNILSQLRNFVEYIADKVYANGSDLDPNNYALNVEALKYLQTRGDLRFLHQFHELLQKSVSHYTLDENGSERLMLKYYEYLLKIKIFLNDTYGLHVLDNIEDFPLDTDTELSEYHEKIAEKICSPSQRCSTSIYSDRYYIQKIKPFFVNQRIYYEVTFTAANSKMSKFDRVIAFSRYEILSNYAVKLSIRNDSINVLGKDMTIQIIDGWNVSIRPCELDNFADIIGKHSKINTGTKEYSELMRFLTETKMPLSELVACSERYYGFVKNQITSQARTTYIFDTLDQCREIILSNKPGCNVLKYLLYHLNNRIIKWQRWNDGCSLLSGLNLSYGCIPFDRMPFCTSLRNHNPRIYDLLDCLSEKGREHELFARHIQNNTEIETEQQLSKLDEGRKNNMIAIRDLEMTKERLLSFAEYAKDAQPEVLVTLIRTIVERIYIVDKDDERYCHIFIKGCSGEDYTGFFQTAGYIEQKTTPVCDSEQYCIRNLFVTSGNFLIQYRIKCIVIMLFHIGSAI